MGTKPHFLELFTCKLVLGQWSFMNFLDLELISTYAEKKGIFVCVKLIGFSHCRLYANLETYY